MCLRGTIQLKWSNEISSRVSLVECHALQESNGMPRRAGRFGHFIWKLRTIFVDSGRRGYGYRVSQTVQRWSCHTEIGWVDKDYLNQLYNKGVDFFKERSPSLPSTRSTTRDTFELLCRFLVFSLGSWHTQPPHTATHSSHRSNTILELRVAFDSELLLFLQL